MQRIRLVVGCAFMAACLMVASSPAQDSQVVKVGITVLGSASGITGVAARDRLVKAFNKLKKSTVQAVPLEATGDQVSTEARQKDCVFVVFTTLTEAHSEGGASGKAGQTTNIPEYHTTVEYKLYRVSDATVAATGSAIAQDIGSLGEVVQQALDHVAPKVVADIKNLGTPK
jgi:ABC-type glycerol-3-phosphate transport system substrate-binding protein